jgi:hypothetical protein
MTMGEYLSVGFVSPNMYRKTEPIPSPLYVFSSRSIYKKGDKNHAIKERVYFSFPKNEFDEQNSDDYTCWVSLLKSPLKFRKTHLKPYQTMNIQDGVFFENSNIFCTNLV